jgi:homoserine O-acetyltransferase
MVATQHRLLTEHLGLDSLHAVVGLSMGGMQAFAWMTRHPSFMDKVVSITGTPRLTPQDRLLWRAELRAFRATDPNGTRAAMKAVSAIHGLHLHTPEHLATMDSTDFRDFVAQREEHILAFDPHDWAWQIKAMLRHDVTAPFGGSLSRAAAAVEADALVVTMTQDHMVNPRPARRFARAMDAERLALDTPCGHLGTGCKADTARTTVAHFLRDDP